MNRFLMILTLCCMSFLGVTSCVYNHGLSGNIYSSAHDVGDNFEAIDISGPIHVQYAGCSSVEVAADETIAPYVKVFVRDGVLYVKVESVVRNQPPVEVRIPFRNGLKALTLSGVAVFVSDCSIHTPTFRLKASGASRFVGGVKTHQAEISMSGASSAELLAFQVSEHAEMRLTGGSSISGVADISSLHIDFSGASRLVPKKVGESYLFKVGTLEGHVDGASRVRMHVISSIGDFTVTGCSSFVYSGHPEQSDDFTVDTASSINRVP